MKALILLFLFFLSPVFLLASVEPSGNGGSGGGGPITPGSSSAFEIPGIDGVQLPNWQIPQVGSVGASVINFKMQPVIRFDGYDSYGRIIFSRLQKNRFGVAETEKIIANSEGDLPEMWVEALIQSSNEPGSWWIVGDEYQSARPYR